MVLNLLETHEQDLSEVDARIDHITKSIDELKTYLDLKLEESKSRDSHRLLLLNDLKDKSAAMSHKIDSNFDKTAHVSEKIDSIIAEKEFNDKVKEKLGARIFWFISIAGTATATFLATYFEKILHLIK